MYFQESAPLDRVRGDRLENRSLRTEGTRYVPAYVQ